jgi:hypothetical protein
MPIAAPGRHPNPALPNLDPDPVPLTARKQPLAQRMGHGQLTTYCVEKLNIEIGDSVGLNSKRGLHSG